MLDERGVIEHLNGFGYLIKVKSQKQVIDRKQNIRNSRRNVFHIRNLEFSIFTLYRFYVEYRKYWGNIQKNLQSHQTLSVRYAIEFTHSIESHVPTGAHSISLFIICGTKKKCSVLPSSKTECCLCRVGFWSMDWCSDESFWFEGMWIGISEWVV